MMRKETEVALLAEEVGMDFLLLPEHHFDPNYSMMPDNMQWLSYLSPARRTASSSARAPSSCPGTRTRRASRRRSRMLQILLGDRFMLGFGRGLAREEYRAFGVDMNTSRERFDQAAEIILDILDTGIAEYDTPYFKQSRTERHAEARARLPRSRASCRSR
jgi:alkanesulfonate monooxygenase SsuD/methylene tetrahydromethanopterin reductase-like flavin-dependent oxidoreductase (luciferase family)